MPKSSLVMSLLMIFYILFSITVYLLQKKKNAGSSSTKGLPAGIKFFLKRDCFQVVILNSLHLSLSVFSTMIATRTSPLANKYYHICFLF